jgi:hypothetical protein
MAFLFVLNLYLQGRLRWQIEVILAWLTFAMGLASLFIFGWQFGIAMILLWFLFVSISHLLASRLAFLLLGYRTGIQQEPYYDIATQHLMSGNIEEALKIHQEQEEKLNQRLEAIGRRPNVAAILSKNSLNSSDLRKLYRTLESCGLEDIAWKILVNPRDLEELIKFQQKSEGRDAMFEFAASMRRRK